MDNGCSVKSTESEGLEREAEGKTEETLSNSEQDVLEVESGVESFSGDGELFDQRDWTPSYNDLIELDLTAEQAQETLRYFSLASTRTNQMMKTHNDLDAVLQLLHEKEKDLELAGKIGQSLLERNKQLLGKMHAFEEFISESGDREDQLRHDVAMKSDLLRRFLKEQEVEDLFAESIKIEDDTRSSDDSCRDDSMNTLQYKCQQLEEHNSHLILEALKIKEETAHVELKEQQLVADCVKQLVEAQGQITTLTDEIASKGEDNIRQQEEITQLISTVVDLQRRHSQLMEDNEELQSLLSNSQCSQEQLKTQVEDLHDKYKECLEMLMENKREVKILNKKVDNGVPPATASHLPSVNPRESLAVEIEETLKRDLNSLQEKRQHTARVLNAVRSLNTVKGGKKLKKSTRQSRPGAPAPSSPSPEPSDDEKMGTSPPQSDPVPDRGPLSTSFGRRSFRKPEKLQIVKPIKGSATLHQWKKLANPTMNLADNRPGVHVKGQVKSPQKGPPQRDKPDGSELDSDEDEPLTMRASSVEGGAANTGGSEKNLTVVPPSNLGLMSLMNKQSTPKALSQAGVQPGSILASLLNTTSEASPAKDSVGQVLAKVLDRASKDASDKEPARAESLRSLAKYFSEKEREGSPIKRQPTKAPPPVSPTITPSSGGGILSTILASRGLSLGMTSPKPLTTTANTDGLTTTTTSSLMSRGSLVRNASGGNLMSLARSAGSGLGSSDKRRSLDTSSLVGASANLSDLSEEKITRMPRMSRRASSGDLQEFFSTSPTPDPFADGSGSRLSRSSSFGNIKDLPPNEAPSGPIGGSFFGGLRRSPSLGSLTNLVQRANIGVAIPPQRATSLDSDTVFKPSQSPPSPSRFEPSGGLSFFGNSSSVSHSALTSTDPPPGAPRGGLFTGSRLSGLAGVGNIWSQAPKREAGMSTSSPSVPTAVEKGASSEERLDKINKAFAFEDFGGLGLMSFFGGKTRRPKSSNE